MFSMRKKKKVAPKRKWAVSDSDSDDGKGGDDVLECKSCGAEPDIYCLDCKLYFCMDDFTAKHQEAELEALPKPDPPPPVTEDPKPEGDDDDTPAADDDAPAAYAAALASDTAPAEASVGDGNAAGEATKAEKAEKSEKSEAAEEVKVERTVEHQYRPLVGLAPYRLDTLACGWEVNQDEPRRLIFRNKQVKDKLSADRKAVAEKKNGEALEAERAALEAEQDAMRSAKRQRLAAEYAQTQLEAEMRNRRDLRRGILPRSLGGGRRNRER